MQVIRDSKKAIRDPILLNVLNLAETVSKTETKNIAKFNQIKSLNSDFDFKLYKPSIPSYETRQQLGLAQDIMLRQIDRLMQDQQKLNIELDKHQIKIKQHERKVEKQIMLSMDHFTFLRKLWKKQQMAQGTDDKVDKLIHNVGSIKGHIINLIKKENQFNMSPPEIHELVVSSPQYCHLLKKYEQLKSNFQENNQRIQINFNSDNQIENQDVSKIRKELENQIQKLKQQLERKNQQILNLRLSNKREEIIQNNPTTKKYNISSTDGSFTIRIQQQITKQLQIQDGIKQFENKVQSTKPIVSKQSLESILKFIETGQVRKTSSKNAIQIEGESRPRKFTVEQITRAKFISNRQTIGGKAQQINPV